MIYSSQLDAILLSTDSPARRRFYPKVQPLTLSYTTSDEKRYPFNIPSIEKLVPLSHIF